MKLTCTALIGAFCLSGLLAGCSATFTGRVAVKGSEPFTYLAIETPEYGELKITGALAPEIRSRYQGRILTVEGSIRSQGAGPGFPGSLDVARIVDVQ